MFVDEHTVMLDPTCGSGTAVRAAEEMKAANVRGLEIDKEFADKAIIALEKSRLINGSETIDGAGLSML
jgi:hypothetical protein